MKINVQDWSKRKQDALLVFFAFQDSQNEEGLLLNTNSGIFFEFIPANEISGNNPTRLSLQDVKVGENYALIINNNAGLWGYNIGDTVKFVDLERHEVAITGRTKHFLSLVGEHLSVENMNRAIQLASEDLNISIPEYTVVGFPYKNFFAHKWYIATNDAVDTERLRKHIDDTLRALNDDYATERDSALKDVFLEVLPEDKFLAFMKLKGKLGSQHKFPRVMKGKMLEDWDRFLQTGAV